MLFYQYLSGVIILNLNFFSISAAQLSYNFAVGGDWGCTSDTKKTIKLIEENKNPELILNRRYFL